MTGSARRSPARLVVYALIPVVVLGVLAEALLRVLDVAAPPDPIELAHGFDPDVDYLAPDPLIPGSTRTRLFAAQPERERTIPPRSALRRVVLLGGSNVQLFPDLVLLEALRERSPEPDWEVVNLGRAGYGSTRVAILLEQALALRPDVVVVYSGHNEFVELGFRRECERGGVDPARASDLPWWRRLRVVEGLAAVAGGAFSGVRTPRDPQGFDEEIFADVGLDDTRAVSERYGQNLEQMVAACEAAGVPIVLCTVVGNMLAPPHASVWPGDRDDVDGPWRRFRSAVTRMPERVRAALSPPRRLSASKWGSLVLGEASFVLPWPDVEIPRVPTLRGLRGPLADPPRRDLGEEETVAGAHWPDPRLWQPVVFEVLATIEALHAPALTQNERRRVTDAAEILEDVIAEVPDNAEATFMLGIARLVLGEPDAARALLDRAATLDVLPRRGNALTNTIVRRLAATHPSATLLDAATLFTGRCPDRIVGYEVMMDVCHLQPGARAVLMEDIADAITGVLGR